MKYILIMAEGTFELAFMNVLLEKGLLKITRRELLGNKYFIKTN